MDPEPREPTGWGKPTEPRGAWTNPTGHGGGWGVPAKRHQGDWGEHTDRHDWRGLDVLPNVGNMTNTGEIKMSLNQRLKLFNEHPAFVWFSTSDGVEHFFTKRELAARGWEMRFLDNEYIELVMNIFISDTNRTHLLTRDEYDRFFVQIFGPEKIEPSDAITPGD